MYDHCDKEEFYAADLQIHIPYTFQTRGGLQFTGGNNEVYEFVAFIAQGGYGTVSKVKKKGESDQFYAVKSFPTAQDEENEEYQAFQDTSHIENIVKAHTMVKVNGFTHIVMEILEGGDLWDYLLEYGWIPRHQALALFSKLVATVGKLLRLGLYPGDIKAENLFYDKKKKSLKLLDLGGLKHMKKKNGTQKKVATTCFSPPEYHLENDISKKEQMNIGELHLSWTLGLLLWHMISGEQKCIYGVEDIHQFQLRSPPYIHGLEESETFHLVLQLLAINPSERLKFWELHQQITASATTNPIPETRYTLAYTDDEGVDHEHSYPLNLDTILEYENRDHYNKLLQATTSYYHDHTYPRSLLKIWRKNPRMVHQDHKPM